MPPFAQKGPRRAAVVFEQMAPLRPAAPYAASSANATITCKPLREALGRKCRYNRTLRRLDNGPQKEPFAHDPVDGLLALQPALGHCRVISSDANGTNTCVHRDEFQGQAASVPLAQMEPFADPLAEPLTDDICAKGAIGVKSTFCGLTSIGAYGSICADTLRGSRGSERGAASLALSVAGPMSS